MSQFYDQASLVMIPSGVKDGKVYSQKPLSTDGQLTFSRGADVEATRINSQGLIEKAKVNLLLQSNTFSTTWSAVNASVTGGQAGYDSTNDAWKLESTLAGVSASVRQFVAINGVSSYSVYAKAGNVNFINLYCASSGTPFYAWFNLSTGAVATTASDIDTSITSVGGGWYRVTLTGLNPNQRVDIYPANTNGSYITAVGEYIYIQDSQLNYGLVAQDYVETTTAAVVSGITDNMPRLNYDPANPTCPSLLLEPSRTNLVTQSEYIADSSYTKTNATVSTNTAIAPDGTLSASTVASTATNGFIQGVATASIGVVYTMSVWLKRKTGTGGVQLRGATNTSTTVTITNEWARYSVTLTANDVYGRYGVLLNTSGDEVYAWGFQLEAGSYPTSYIPTYGTSATRTADACSKTGISSLIGQSEGTLFVEFTIDRSITSTDRVAILNDGTGNERIGISLGATNLLYAFVVDGGTTTAEIVRSGTTAGTYKAAFAYKANDFAFYVNGSLVGTDTSGTVASCSRLDLGNQLGSSPLGGEISQTLLFTQRLPNSDLATLTSL